MRDKKRIKPFLKELEELWKENPDMRFFQLITMVMQYLPPCDPFYCEESDWKRAFEKCRDIEEE
jgi:hypothetical protein